MMGTVGHVSGHELNNGHTLLLLIHNNPGRENYHASFLMSKRARKRLECLHCGQINSEMQLIILGEPVNGQVE